MACMYFKGILIFCAYAFQMTGNPLHPLPEAQSIKDFADAMDGFDNFPKTLEFLQDAFAKHGISRQLVQAIPGPLRGLLAVTNFALDSAQWGSMAALFAKGDYAGGMEIILDKAVIKSIAATGAGVAGAMAGAATSWLGIGAIFAGAGAGIITYNAIERGLGTILDNWNTPENRAAINDLLGAELHSGVSPARIRSLISIAPSGQGGDQVYPTYNTQLETIKRLKQQAEAHPEQKTALSKRIEEAAVVYLGNGYSVRDALVSYYHQAPLAVEAKVIHRLEGNADYLRAVDGADGSARDGLLNPMEIAAGMVKMGVYNSKADADRSGDLNYQEAVAAQRTPAKFQASVPAPVRH